MRNMFIRKSCYKDDLIVSYVFSKAIFIEIILHDKNEDW